MKPLVSVVIPAYNPPKDLFRQCIKSIVNQNIDNIEIVIIDDGSKIPVESYIDDYVDKNFIKIITQNNSGEGAARNRGIQEAVGKYIMFVDADDSLAKGWIMTALKLAEKYEADFICGKIKICDKVSAIEEQIDYQVKVFDKSNIWMIQRDQFLESTSILSGLDYIDIGACAKLYRSAIVKHCHFPEGVILSADQVFNHKIISMCKTIVVTNYCSYYYITNGESISHTYKKDAVEIMMSSLELLQPYLLDNKEVKNAFWLHVILDMVRGCEIEFVTRLDKQDIFSLSKQIKKIYKEPLIDTAIKCVNLQQCKSITKRRNAVLLVKRHTFLYLLYRKFVHMLK